MSDDSVHVHQWDSMTLSYSVSSMTTLWCHLEEVASIVTGGISLHVCVLSSLCRSMCTCTVEHLELRYLYFPYHIFPIRNLTTQWFSYIWIPSLPQVISVGIVAGGCSTTFMSLHVYSWVLLVLMSWVSVYTSWITCACPCVASVCDAIVHVLCTFSDPPCTRRGPCV